jgi:hypothetical protein
MPKLDINLLFGPFDFTISLAVGLILTGDEPGSLATINNLFGLFSEKS